MGARTAVLSHRTANRPDRSVCRPSGAARRLGRTRRRGGDRLQALSRTRPATDARGHPCAPPNAALPQTDNCALRSSCMQEHIFPKYRMRSYWVIGYRGLSSRRCESGPALERITAGSQNVQGISTLLGRKQCRTLRDIPFWAWYCVMFQLHWICCPFPHSGERERGQTYISQVA